MMKELNFFVYKKLVNIFIKKGKKAKALSIFLRLIENLKYNKNINNKSILEVFHQSLNNIKPLLHVKKIRKSNKLFYSPRIITNEQRIKVSIRWLVISVNTRRERTLNERLEKEFLDCFFGKGSTIMKKHGIYKTILKNRPFLHWLKRIDRF